MAKRLYRGDRAPFDGTLLDDESLRSIDVEMTEKRICENNLDKATQSCDSISSNWPGNFVYFVMGAAVGFLVFNSVSR